MRFKRVYLLSIAALLLCVSPSLEGKGKPQKPQPPPANTVYAGFDCPQAVDTCDVQGSQHLFNRVEVGPDSASYDSVGPIPLYSNLGDPEPGYVVNDPDGICSDLGGEFTEEIAEGRFHFYGFTNQNLANVRWVYERDLDDDGDQEKISFFCRDEAFGFGANPGDPFEGVLTEILCNDVFVRVEGYIPEGRKRGKTFQCGWNVSVDFTVDGR